MTIPGRILGVSAAWRVVSVSLLLVATHAQQAFDTSGEIVQHTLQHRTNPAAWDVWSVPFVRWDTVYFVAAAAEGYTYEQMLAFQPGIVGLLRLAGYASLNYEWSPTVAVLITTVLANAATWLSPLLLYYALRNLTKSERLAEKAALLSIIAPASTSALSAPTPEPFYSFFTLLGLVLLSDGRATYAFLRRLLAACFFAAATSFRANGILLTGFLVWHAAWMPQRQGIGLWLGRMLAVLPLVGLAIFPWAAFQAWAYARLCTGGMISPWCTATLPLAYSYIQSVYWYVSVC